MTWTWLLLPSLMFLQALFGMSQAQIVNVESKRPGSSEEGWHGSVGLRFNYTQNTRQVFTIGTKTSVQFLKDRHRLLFLTDLRRVRAGGTDFLNNGYQHIRYNFDAGDQGSFSYEAFQQVQYNAIQKIQFRNLTGVGIRWNAVNQDSLKLWMGSLPMFEYEQITDGVENIHFRKSSYLLFYWLLPKGIEFQTITYYQPRLDWWGDYRLSTNTTLEFGISTWLRFKTGLDLLYDTNPPEGIPSLILSIENGLVVEF